MHLSFSEVQDAPWGVWATAENGIWGGNASRETLLFLLFKLSGIRSLAIFSWKGWEVREGVTVLGDNQKSETQPQVCLSEILYCHTPCQDLWCPSLEPWHPLFPDTVHSKESWSISFAKRFRKVSQVEQTLTLVYTYNSLCARTDY